MIVFVGYNTSWFVCAAVCGVMYSRYENEQRTMVRRRWWDDCRIYNSFAHIRYSYTRIATALNFGIQTESIRRYLITIYIDVDMMSHPVYFNQIIIIVVGIVADSYDMWRVCVCVRAYAYVHSHTTNRSTHQFICINMICYWIDSIKFIINWTQNGIRFGGLFIFSPIWSFPVIVCLSLR